MAINYIYLLRANETKLIANSHYHFSVAAHNVFYHIIFSHNLISFKILYLKTNLTV